MNVKFKIALFILFVCFYGHVDGKKNMGKFRMDKINFIWEKAANQLSKERLEKLRVKFKFF